MGEKKKKDVRESLIAERDPQNKKEIQEAPKNKKKKSGTLKVS